MGNQQGTQRGSSVGTVGNMYPSELAKIHDIINGMLNEKDVFRNPDYNFLSQDVCAKNYMVIENDLQKHLKVNLTSVGQALYVIPKETDTRINKTDICKKIATHYMKILYVLMLVKSVLNVERRGEHSISGIILQNVKVVNDLLQINYCAVPQKDYSKDVTNAKYLDFSKLEGLQFFTQYFLSHQEATAYTRILRQVLNKSTKGQMQKVICDSSASTSHLQELFTKRFGEQLVCSKRSDETQHLEVGNQGSPLHVMKPLKLDLRFQVAAFNPVFSGSYCMESHKLVVQTKTEEGAKVLRQYNTLVANYKRNLVNIEAILDRLVIKERGGKWVLRDLDKKTLEGIIMNAKEAIKVYYIQSLFDYHLLLEMGKNVPNINMQNKK